MGIVRPILIGLWRSFIYLVHIWGNFTELARALVWASSLAHVLQKKKDECGVHCAEGFLGSAEALLLGTTVL